MTEDNLDITAEAVTETATLHLKNASGELMYADAERTKPRQVILYGPGSKQFALVESRQSARSLKRYTDNDNKVTAPSAEEKEREEAEDLATMTKGFVNFTYPPAGDAQGFDLFKAVYADKKLGFIAKQVNKFAADWGNFKGGSAQS